MPVFPAIMFHNARKGVVVVQVSSDFVRILCVDGYLVKALPLSQVNVTQADMELAIATGRERVVLQSPFVDCIVAAMGGRLQQCKFKAQAVVTQFIAATVDVFVDPAGLTLVTAAGRRELPFDQVSEFQVVGKTELRLMTGGELLMLSFNDIMVAAMAAYFLGLRTRPGCLEVAKAVIAPPMPASGPTFASPRSVAPVPLLQTSQIFRRILTQSQAAGENKNQRPSTQTDPLFSPQHVDFAALRHPSTHDAAIDGAGISALSAISHQSPRHVNPLVQQALDESIDVKRSQHFASVQEERGLSESQMQTCEPQIEYTLVQAPVRQLKHANQPEFTQQTTINETLVKQPEEEPQINLEPQERQDSGPEVALSEVQEDKTPDTPEPDLSELLAASVFGCVVFNQNRKKTQFMRLVFDAAQGQLDAFFGDRPDFVPSHKRSFFGVSRVFLYQNGTDLERSHFAGWLLRRAAASQSPPPGLSKFEVVKDFQQTAQLPALDKRREKEAAKARQDIAELKQTEKAAFAELQNAEGDVAALLFQTERGAERLHQIAQLLATQLQ